MEREQRNEMSIRIIAAGIMTQIVGLVPVLAPGSSSAVWCLVNCQVPGHVPRSRSNPSLLDLGKHT
jgi:hypothetical protein